MSSQTPGSFSQGPGNDRARLAAVTACFFLSGFAALLYQTAWLREFSLVFGTSELAVAAVLAAYMGGLAAGAAVVGRYVQRIRRPVLVYGALEGAIALSALAVPVLLLLARSLYVWLLGDQPAPPDAAATGQTLFYLAVAFLVLALPTGFMGATLPLLTRYAVRSDLEVGPRVALLYGINTAGAVAGTLVAAFLLLPALGLRGTVWIGVVANVLVFSIAARLSRGLPDVAASTGPESRGALAASFWRACLAPLWHRGARLRDRLRASFERQPAWVLPLMAISGANAFLYEVLWTRMLAHVLSGSIYAFATMLAAFLAGIALGSGIAGKAAARRQTTALAFASVQFMIALLSMLIYGWMGALLPSEQTTAALTTYAILVMLPATVFIGATFPLAVRLLAGNEREASAATAKVYAWNTVGAIAGAILGGFLVIPSLGFEGAIKLAVTVNLALALWSAAFVAARRAPAVATAAASFVLVAAFYHPSRPQAVVARTGFIPEALAAPTELFYAVGRSSTVMLLGEDGYYYLRTNGLPEASIAAKGRLASGDATRWLGALPVLARPNAQSMLVIGYGGGVALEGVPHSVQAIDAVELEPEVINANRRLEGKRDFDPLQDPRVHIVLNDARNALRLTSKRYDAIVSQPSHPWTAGASHLFTREFLAETKQHLNPGGVLVQWMNAEFVDAALLRSLAATLLAEFDHVRLYRPERRFLMFLASDQPLSPERDIARTGRPLTADVMHYSRLRINGVEDMLVALVMDEQGVARFADGAPPSTDNTNRMATDSRSHADGLDAAALDTLLTAFDPLLDRSSWIYTTLGGELSFPYLADRLIQTGQAARAAALADQVPGRSNALLIRALLAESEGRDQAAIRGFVAAVEADPGNAQARFHLLSRLRLGAGDLGSEQARGLLAGLPSAAAAVLTGWRAQAAGDWLSLARLDGQLAGVRVTDAWFPDAARLRAEWRLHVNQNRKQYAFDALRLIDRALLLQPQRDLYLLRAVSAVVLEDGDLIVESCSYVTQSIEAAAAVARTHGIAIPPRELAAMRENLDSVLGQLRGPLVDAAAARTEEVLGHAERARAALN